MKDKNDTFRIAEEAWSNRLEECLKSKGMTQVDLMNELNARFGTSYGQKSVNRWMHVGKDHYGKKGDPTPSFPKYETMFQVAEFFGVQVGYLTGETSCESFEASSACEYLGLDEEAVKSIRLATGCETAFRKTGLHAEENRMVLGKILASDAFFALIRAIYHLDLVYSGPDKGELAWKELEERLSRDELCRAMDLYNCSHVELEEMDPQPTDEEIANMQAVGRAIDLGYEHECESEISIAAEKYYVQKRFDDLLEELYPSR